MPKPLTTKLAMRYNRQIVLPQFDLSGQERLGNSHVVIIGIGGLGCSAAQALAYSGIGELTLVDDDIVSETNLQRQVLFIDADIGQNKALVAQQKLSQLRAGTRINRIEQRLDDSSLSQVVANCDLVLDCSDNLATRVQLVTAAYKVGIPLVSAAAIRFEGQIFISDPKQDTACYGCALSLFGDLNDERHGDLSESCVETGILAPVVMLVGNYQALLAIKKLTQLTLKDTGKLQLFDALEQTWTSFKVIKNRNCAYCNTTEQL